MEYVYNKASMALPVLLPSQMNEDYKKLDNEGVEEGKPGRNDAFEIRLVSIKCDRRCLAKKTS